MAKKEKEAVVFDEAIHGAELKKLIVDAADNKLKISGFQTLISDTRTKAKDDLGVDGKMFNRLLNLYFKSTRDEFEAETEEAIELYDSVFPK